MNEWVWVADRQGSLRSIVYHEIFMFQREQLVLAPFDTKRKIYFPNDFYLNMSDENEIAEHKASGARNGGTSSRTMSVS